WRVRSVNDGGVSEYSAHRSFTTIPAISGVPTLVSPDDEATLVELNENLTWNEVEGALSYDVQVSTDNTFGNVVPINVTDGTSHQLTNLENETVYFWRVRSVNDGGVSEYSAHRSFTTIPAVAGVPTLVSPDDEATLVELNENLTWNEVEGALSYDVQVSTDSTFDDVVEISVTNGSSHQLTNLENETVYFWRVRSVNDGGVSEYAAHRSFTTIPAVAGVPTLVSPDDEATLVELDDLLTWNEVEGALSYDVQVSTDGTFDDEAEISITEGTSYQPTLESATTYYWRVRSVNDGGVSEYSAHRSCTTIPPIAGVPTLVSPDEKE